MYVEVITYCWNEMAILPFALDYWKQYASHVTVYDNGSDDGSREFLEQYKPFVRVIPFGKELNNDAMRHSKCNDWKVYRELADLVVVCDMDEMLIVENEAFEKMLESGATICAPTTYNLMGLIEPKYKGRPLHKVSPRAYFDPNPKAIVFRPDKIEEINYCAGAHKCDPTGEVKWYSGGLYNLHANNGLSIDYRIQRYEAMNNRRSQQDLIKGYASHYSMSEDQIRKEWNEALKKTIDISGVMPW